MHFDSYGSRFACVLLRQQLPLGELYLYGMQKNRGHGRTVSVPANAKKNRGGETPRPGSSAGKTAGGACAVPAPAAAWSASSPEIRRRRSGIARRSRRPALDMRFASEFFRGSSRQRACPRRWVRPFPAAPPDQWQSAVMETGRVLRRMLHR